MAETPLAPIARLEIDPTEITLPSTGKIKLKGSTSFDPNTHGVITNWKFFLDNIVISDSATTDIEINSPAAGNHNVKLIVRDKSGRESIDTDESQGVITVHPEIVRYQTICGAMFGSNTNNVTALNKLEMKGLRLGMDAGRYNTGDRNSMIEDAFTAGFDILLSIKPNSREIFLKPNEVPAWKSQIAKVLDKYAPKIKIIVCGNEPTTDALSGTGPITDYLNNNLVPCIEVCHQYGVKVTDGAIHAFNVERVMKGQNMGEQNVKDVATMIKFYKTIPLDYVNVHHKAVTVADAAVLKVAADYLRAETGKPVLSNEWHPESTDAAVMKAVVQAFKDGKYVYSLCFSGDKAPAPLVKGNDLTPLGIVYRDAAK